MGEIIGSEHTDGQLDIVQPISRNRGFVWLISLLSGAIGIYLYSSEKVVYENAGLWWDGFPWFLYVISVGLLNLALAFTFFEHWRQRNGLTSIVGGIMAIATSILWFVHVYLFRGADELPVFAMSYVIWCLGAITLGVTMILTGIFYEMNSTVEPTLTRLTSLSFVVTGIVGIVIGYVGGFTLFPFITVFEIPVVSIVMIVPSLLAFLYHTRLGNE